MLTPDLQKKEDIAFLAYRLIVSLSLEKERLRIYNKNSFI